MAAPKILSEELLFEFGTARGQSTRVRLVTYEKLGVRLDVRKFFVDESGAPVPTSKGVTLRSEWISKLREALDDFEREAKA